MRIYDDAAKWYDLVSGQGTEDVTFYLTEAKKCRGRVLEIACGTGRIYLPLLQNGVNAYGFDSSTHMLKILNQKAKNLKPNVKRADMRTFKYPFKFDLIIIPFRAFNHMETREDQKKCLKNVYQHLKKGGKLILNFFDPALDIISNSFYRSPKTKIQDPKTGIIYSKEGTSSFDSVHQSIRSATILKRNKEKITIQNVHLCYIFSREFMNMFELCGFNKWKLYGGFKYKPYTKNGQELIWIAYK